MKTLLILEDEADIRELIAMALISLPVECELCSHLSDAQSWLDNHRPDFVLTDLHLPDGDGLELLKSSTKRYPEVPVAVITAFADTDSAIEALRLGAVDYLKKPVDAKSLRTLINRHLLDAPATGTAAPAPAEQPAALSDPEDRERESLRAVLEEHRWNKRAAAQALGLTYRQLRYRVAKLGLD